MPERCRACGSPWSAGRRTCEACGAFPDPRDAAPPAEEAPPGPLKTCPWCRTAVAADARTCPGCEQPFFRTCPFCAEEILAAARKCRWCESWLDRPGGPARGPEPADAEDLRRRIRRDGTTGIVVAILAFLLIAAGNAVSAAMTPSSRDGDAAGSCIALAGVPLWFLGLALIARGRGRSGWWAALGIIWCVGLIVVCVLPRKCRRCGTEAASGSRQCARCEAPV